MAQLDGPQSEPPPTSRNSIDGPQDMDASSVSNQQNEGTGPAEPPSQDVTDDPDPDHDQRHGQPQEPVEPGVVRRISRSVVPGLPRAQTFKRQLSEQRCHLAPVEPDPEERRAVSMDRRLRASRIDTRNQPAQEPQIKDQRLPDFSQKESLSHIGSAFPQVPYSFEEDPLTERLYPAFDDKLEDVDNDAASQDDLSDDRSVASSRYDLRDRILQELETTWILNLSMRYKDHSNREKFFVTYRESDRNWRRVTVTLDYRSAPENSLEMELLYTGSQREKSQKIYEAIRESLPEIQFYETVTNLKLETLEDRLHVHVVEDGNEIIRYPPVSQLAHLGCRRIKERDLIFDHHMSGFVYKVSVGKELLIKKEIPGPDTIDEFLYEINALNSLRYSNNVINFYGLVVDDYDKHVKGLLISYADGGALVDVIYDNRKDKTFGLDWPLKERWARQIVHGLADVHECGFVQGDFTLSNIVIDENDHAKIIDINRRGCPVGWEPPEATPLIESHHRISMYIGVKSDLYQLGMVLWALAMEEDEPEREGRPLTFGSESRIPEWYQQITRICLDPDPRKRLHASMLLHLFPEENRPSAPQISINDESPAADFAVEEPNQDSGSKAAAYDLPSKWWTSGRAYTPTGPPAYQSWDYAPRGRSPPSPLPSNFDDSRESPQWLHSRSGWAANRNIRPTYSDVGDDEPVDEIPQQLIPDAPDEIKPLPSNQDIDQNQPGPQLQEPLELPGSSHKIAEEMVVQDPTEPLAAKQNPVTAEQDPVVAEHDPVTVDKGDNATALEDAPAVEQQPPVANGVVREISPNIVEKTETVQDTPMYDNPLATSGTGPNVPAKENHVKDAQALPNNESFEEGRTYQADNMVPTESDVSPPETETSVDNNPVLSEGKDLTEKTTLPPSETKDDDINSIQMKSGGGDVPTEDETPALANASEAISKSEPSASGYPNDLSVHPGNDKTEENTYPGSILPEEGSLPQEEVKEELDLLLDKGSAEAHQEQGAMGAEDSMASDDAQKKSPDAVQMDLSPTPNTHDGSSDAPVPDAVPISASQGDATTLAHDLSRGRDGSGIERTISSEVSVNTVPDIQQTAGYLTHSMAPTDAASTQSEARSQAIQDTTHYDATPRISPCGKPDTMQSPDALFGIGGGHLAIDERFCHPGDIFNEDLHVGRQEVMPTLIMTTDAT